MHCIVNPGRSLRPFLAGQRVGQAAQQQLRLPVLQQPAERLRTGEHLGSRQHAHRRRHPLPRVAHRDAHPRFAYVERHDAHAKGLSWSCAS